MSPPGKRHRPAGNGAAASEAGGGNRLDASLDQAAVGGADHEPVPLTESAAGSVTSELRQALGSLLWSVHTIRGLIEKARDGQAHLSLGYRSWTEYVCEEFGRDKLGRQDKLGPATKLARDDRQQLVAQLADLGMSTRAIGSFVGAGKSTIADDLRSGVRNRTPEPSGAGDDAAADAVEAIATTSNVVGLDGKAYPRPEPRKERRSPLPDSYSRAVYKLAKAVESLARLHGDDRFLRNRAELERRHGSNAARAATLVQSIASDLAGTLRCQFCGRRLAVTASCCDRCGVCR